ncbi:hypothetical protein J4G37_21675 [Microvirga sp. 3-52]|nr:hypothetical protein [Microvirga sp. 3-52]
MRALSEHFAELRLSYAGVYTASSGIVHLTFHVVIPPVGHLGRNAVEERMPDRDASAPISELFVADLGRFLGAEWP